LRRHLRLLLIAILIVGCAGCATTSRFKIRPNNYASLSKDQAISGELTLERVQREFGQGNLSTVSRLVDIVTVDTPDDQAKLHLYRGTIYSYQNRPQHALQELLACESLLHPAPENADNRNFLYERMGYVYRDLGDIDNMIACFEKRMAGKECSFFRTEIENAKCHRKIEIENPTGATELPIGSYFGFPIVKGFINGLEVNFFLDTGAAFCALSSDVADKLGVKPMDRSVSLYGAVGGCEGFEAIVDPLVLGNAVIKNMPFFVIDKKEMNPTLGPFPLFKIDAIIGIPLLKEFDVTISLKNKTLTLKTPDVQCEPSVYDGNVFLVADSFFFSMLVNHQEVLMHADTCALGKGYLDSKLVESLEEEGADTCIRIRPFTIGAGNNGKGKWLFRAKYVRGATLSLPGYDIAPIALFADGSDVLCDGLIGKTLLKNFDMHIDFQKMQLTFTN